MSIEFKNPVVMVSDMSASRHFYEGPLGQVIANDFGANVIYESGLSLWEAKRAGEIIFGSRELPTGTGDFELYFESEDVASAFARLAEAGAEVIQQVHEEPWGQMSFRCYDPGGNIVEVAEPMDALVRRLAATGQTPGEVSERTQMPLEFVLQVIEEAGRDTGG